MTIGNHHDRSTPPLLDPAPTVRAITVIMGTVVGLTFLYGFGNVLNLALRLGVPVGWRRSWRPRSILGLLLGTRHLALSGATVVQLQPARRLLIFASLVTLALNVAEPVVAGEYGKAAFDAVGPLLLIGWAEVGPGLLQAMAASYRPSTTSQADGDGPDRRCEAALHVEDRPDTDPAAGSDEPSVPREPACAVDDSLLERARQEDARHW